MNESITFYVFAAGLVILASFVANKFKQSFSTEHSKDEYEMVKQYLLNDSPLYGYNRPKLWIHSKYEMNARQWKNFQSRNSTDINQPYLYLTIQSIINHCGNDFHVCLIDDESFSKLIPNWDIDLVSIVEPMRSQFRDIAMLQLLYYYGGFVVPNSFLCTKNLISLYEKEIKSNEWFVIENRSVTKDNISFIHDIEFTGCIKNNETILELITVLKSKWNGHFSQEMEFQGFKNHWLLEHKIKLVNGEKIGIKKRSGKPILLDDLMEESFLDVDMQKLYGIYIPKDEILKRPKYQWFAILPYEDVLNSNIILSKFFKSSIIDSPPVSSEIKSIISL